jgi:hypothetical protein
VVGVRLAAPIGGAAFTSQNTLPFVKVAQARPHLKISESG